MTMPLEVLRHRLAGVLILAALAVSVSACAPTPPVDVGSSATQEPEEQEQPELSEEPETVAQADEEGTGDRIVVDGDADAGAEPADASAVEGEAEPEEVVAGTIELSVESGGVERVFTYEAEHCFVSPEYILAGGTGSEVGASVASEVGISSAPAELLHEATGTYQAEGIISVRTEGSEIVTDGRMVTVEGNRIPSTFTYRHDHNSAHYVVAWFEGDSQIGAGYVKVNCDY